MKLKTILTTLLLSSILIFSACNSSNKNAEEETVVVLSQERVSLSSAKADSYSWTQVSGEEVILINSKQQSMSFIAPRVDKEIELLFEVKMIVDSKVQTKRIKVKVKPIKKPKDSNTTTNNLISITLSITNNSLNIDSNTSLNAVATYEDNTTKDITDTVEWINTDSNAVVINKYQLLTKKETNIILQARLNTVLSNAVGLEIYQEINGHRLPPQPNQALNDSTLLGIDSNNNGVRDDVERYLLEKYKDHHKIVSEIALQSGRAFQIVLEHPENARETTKLMSAARACNNYFNHSASSYGDPILIDSDIVEYEYKELQLNTKERIRVYLEYNHNLSGGVYSMTVGLKRKAKCDFNVTELLKAP